MTTLPALTPVSFMRNILKMMSDYTVLSSIENFDFRHRIVTIKNGYWKFLVTFVKRKFSGLHSLGRLLSIIKSLYLERFTSVSARKLKDFFNNKIRNSFFDFKNMFYYSHDFMLHGNIFKKDLEKLRKDRYFESKAKKFYQRYLNSLLPGYDTDIEFTPVIEANYVLNDELYVQMETHDDQIETFDDFMRQVTELGGNLHQTLQDPDDSSSDYADYDLAPQRVIPTDSSNQSEICRICHVEIPSLVSYHQHLLDFHSSRQLVENNNDPHFVIDARDLIDIGPIPDTILPLDNVGFGQSGSMRINHNTNRSTITVHHHEPDIPEYNTDAELRAAMDSP